VLGRVGLNQRPKDQRYDAVQGFISTSTLPETGSVTPGPLPWSEESSRLIIAGHGNAATWTLDLEGVDLGGAALRSTVTFQCAIPLGAICALRRHEP